MVLAMVLALAVGVSAEDVKIPNDGGQPGPRVECDVTGCPLYIEAVGETLVTDQGHIFGPIDTDAHGDITNVVLRLDIWQTWVGDLVAGVYYDADGNGSYDFGPVYVLCRPNLADCPFPDGCCGCSGNVGSGSDPATYTFGDDALESLGDPNCPTEIPSGCYLPAPESPHTFAEAFAGAPSGGHFYLEIGDAVGGDDTYLGGWGVFVCTSTTATEKSSWGRVKKMYR